MVQNKILFIDRDGTLIEEPDDFQIDRFEKLSFVPDVIPSLLKLKQAGFSFVMISNQDGLGTASLPIDDFKPPHELMLRLFASQGIYFEAIRICPHMPDENCECRKPKLGLVMDYVVKQKINRQHSYVIGDRETDIEFATNLGIQGIRIDHNKNTWRQITDEILNFPRCVAHCRKTNETMVSVKVNLDKSGDIKIDTGIGFFDHMLEQLAKHGGFNLSLAVKGDLEIDDHHTVEDAAITLGEAIRKALDDKFGIRRYGFVLPMDESLAQVAIDLCGRSYFVFEGQFKRECVGDLSTELVSHFFRSFADALKATLHINVQGENTHHMIESIYKCVGRALRQAFEKQDDGLPSTKGVL